MSDDFTGEHDMEETEDQDLPMERSNPVRRTPVLLHDMAMVALAVTQEKTVEGTERKDPKRAMKEQLK